METRSEKNINVKNRDAGLRMLETALGPIAAFFQDAKVEDIMLNADGRLWVRRSGSKCRDTGLVIGIEESTRLVKLVAAYCGAVVTENKSILSAELPYYGYRMEANMPPTTTAPAFAIRIPSREVFFLDDYVKSGIMTAHQAEVIRRGVWEKKNILFVGGTGSGKTTAVKAVLEEISKTGDRLIILEDTRELTCSADCILYQCTSAGNDMTALLKSAMRLCPDRIIVGEVRDGAALALLKAWNTGHPGGVSTLHADNAYAGLIRLESLIQEAIPSPQPQLIAEAVDLVVYIAREQQSRKVKEMAFVKGYKNGTYQLEYVEE